MDSNASGDTGQASHPNDTRVAFTLVAANGAVGKRLDLVPNPLAETDDVRKTTLGAIGAGTFAVVETTIAGLAATLERLTGLRAAFMAMVPVDGKREGNILSAAYHGGSTQAGMIRLGGADVEWGKPALCTFDGDNLSALGIASLEDFEADLRRAGWTGALVLRPSSGSNIWVNGKERIGLEGARAYGVALDGNDVSRVLKAMHGRLVLAGRYHVRFAETGQVLIRTAVDVTLGSRGRLDYTAATLGKGLDQRRAAPVLSGTGAVDTVAIALSDQETTRVAGIELHERERNAEASARLREAWIDRRLDEAVSARLAEGLEGDPKDAAAMKLRLAEEGLQRRLRAVATGEQEKLDPDFAMTIWPKGAKHKAEVVTVRQLVKAGKKYVGWVGPDPVEPGYRGGAEVAWVEANPGTGLPSKIDTKAHAADGGRKYLLPDRLECQTEAERALVRARVMGNHRPRMDPVLETGTGGVANPVLASGGSNGHDPRPVPEQFDPGFWLAMEAIRAEPVEEGSLLVGTNAACRAKDQHAAIMAAAREVAKAGREPVRGRRWTFLHADDVELNWLDGDRNAYTTPAQKVAGEQKEEVRRLGVPDERVERALGAGWIAALFEGFTDAEMIKAFATLQKADVAGAVDVFRYRALGRQFPRGCLPPEADDYVDRVFDAAGTDRNLTASALVTTLSACVRSGTKLALRPSGDALYNFEERPMLWTVLIAPSGSRKTAAMRIALLMTTAIEAILKEHWQDRWQAAFKVARARTDEFPTTKAATVQANREEGTEAPVVRMSNVTPEGARDRMAEVQQKGVMVLLDLDEMLALLRTMFRNGYPTPGRAEVLKGYDGGPQRVMRASSGSGSIYVLDWAFCMLAGIQPDKLGELAKMEMDADGFLPRCNVIFGDYAARHRSAADDEGEGSDEVADGDNFTPATPGADVLERLLVDAAVEMSRFPIITHRMTEKAARRLRRFEEEHSAKAAELKAGGAHGALVSYMQRGAGRVARLATVLHHLDQAIANRKAANLEEAAWRRAARVPGASPSATISAEVVERALRLYEGWLLSHTTAYYEAQGGNDQRVRRFAGWLLGQDAEGVRQVTLRDIGRAKVLDLDGVELVDFLTRMEPLGWFTIDRPKRNSLVVEITAGISERFADDLELHRRRAVWVQEQIALVARPAEEHPDDPRNALYPDPYFGADR